MSVSIFCLCFLLSLCFIQCQQKIATVSIDHPPTFTEIDQKYADVFQPLDGTWKGQFIIYEDTQRQNANQMDLKNISLSNLERSSLQSIGNIQVEQVYTSESPYFQKVIITDFYPETNQKIISRGVNKVENGKMLCIVKKPDETVMHDGYIDAEDDHTIIWHRAETTPQKIEFFRETVLEKTYEIIGWGYYEGDDTQLSPRLWFHGKYVKQ